ncbi:MAG: type II toxin-antitoxin system ParD family antitoxin [Tepidisphaeraceae bacterium]
MEIEVDPRRRRYLSAKVRSGQFRSPSDVVSFALDRLRDDERKLAELRREIRKGIDSLDRGDAKPWDVEQAKTRFLRRVRRPRRKS